MERTLLVGPGGAGKTEKLWQYYSDLAGKDCTDSILVLLWNARDVRDWRERVDFPWAGPIHVYTYFGWVQREIRRCWPRLEPWGKMWLEPEFLTVETSQFAMLRHIQARQGDFAGLVTSPERLAIQLGSCLVLASLNGIPFSDIGNRLAAAMPAKDSKIFASAQEILDSYIAEAEKTGTLDYGLAVSLYRSLLEEPWYRRELRQFKHLLADDVDEQSPAAHDLIAVFLEHVDRAVLTFSTDGGHAGFFGADAPGGWQRFGDVGKIVPVRPRRGLGAGRAVYTSILRGTAPVLPRRRPKIELIHEDLRSELLERTGERVVRLLGEGVPAAEIAVIAPLADKVLEHTLALHLKEAGVPLNVLTKNRRLIDEPYVRAMMTLALLAHPQWQLDWGVPDLAQSLQLLLKLDPVRAWLLSRQVRGCELAPLELWQRERVGFRAAQGYDLLRQWLDDYRQGPEAPIDIFLQRVFGELLSRLPPARDDLVVCRQLLASARKFLNTTRRLDLGADTGAAFIRMLSAGTVAAESLLEPANRERAVILATPYAYISGHMSSAVQVWMDCTGRRWFQQDVRELLNPHVLSARWPRGEIWSDEYNQSVSLQNGARVARALLRRCGKHLIVAAANVDSQGFEQEGQLLAALYGALVGEEEKDALSAGTR
ncbi:MAG TPA: hypothetical protein PKN71_06920 [Bacillota bacterium]|nr:hypothetical protein [Bacillota bacterium]